MIVTEPTEMELAVSHKGFVWFDIETYGVASHGSRPHLGVDAIAKMGKVLVEIGAARPGAARPTDPSAPRQRLHSCRHDPGRARAVLSIRPTASCTVERRTVPGETPDLAQAQVQAILDRCAAADSAFRAKLTRGLARDSFDIDEAAPFVQLCQRHLAQATDRAAEISGASYWCDAASVLCGRPADRHLGPTGAGAHASVEWIDLDTVQQCADVYTAVAQEFCS